MVSISCNPVDYLEPSTCAPTLETAALGAEKTLWSLIPLSQKAARYKLTRMMAKKQHSRGLILFTRNLRILRC